MINTAIDLWEEIQANRNFDEKYYDKKEAEYIKNILGLPVKNRILVGLKKSNVSVEELIKVFFEANQSYTTMMSDLLNMFQEIGAKQTDHQLEISFEFDKGKPYTIDLEYFKSQIEKWKTVEKEILIPDNPEKDDFWKFSKKLNSLDFSGSVDYQITDYRSINVEFNVTKNEEINHLLDLYKDFLIAFVKEVQNYGIDKRTLGNYNAVSAYVNLALDNWPWIVSTQLMQMAEVFDELKDEHQKDCLCTLQDFLKLSGFKKKTVEEQVKFLEDYLDLPFWKKRYELYSVWIFKLIYDVIKTHDHKVHVTNGKLVFPFKETHLATLYLKTGQNIFIYCEKKTPLDNPVGKGRRKNIQPDYSFFIEPLSDVNSSILEIECKQYKKPSNDSFARALIDYSNGRPKTKVFLVNHGEMNSANIIKKANQITKDFESSRCDLFASVVPTTEKVLKKAIEKILFKEINVFNLPVITAKLTWGSHPTDLDLSLHHIYFGEENIVNYQNKMFNDIIFKEDVTNGFGPEEITFTVKKDMNYRFIVNDYTQTGDLYKSGAKVEFLIDNKVINTFEIDKELDNENIWNVCVIKSVQFDGQSFSLIYES